MHHLCLCAADLHVIIIGLHTFIVCAAAAVSVCRLPLEIIKVSYMHNSIFATCYQSQGSSSITGIIKVNNQHWELSIISVYSALVQQIYILL